MLPLHQYMGHVDPNDLSIILYFTKQPTVISISLMNHTIIEHFKVNFLSFLGNLEVDWFTSKRIDTILQEHIVLQL